MNLLLDTSYLYALAGECNLSSKEAGLLVKPPGRLVVSAVSIWEVRLKWNAIRADGTRKGPKSPMAILELLDEEDMDRLPLTEAHAVADLVPPLTHSDPFDELLLVQAQVEGLKLLTRDDKLQGHPCSFAL